MRASCRTEGQTQSLGIFKISKCPETGSGKSDFVSHARQTALCYSRHRKERSNKRRSIIAYTPRALLLLLLLYHHAHRLERSSTLAVLPKISSSFSLAGSSWIVVEVWPGSTVRPNRHMTVPHRSQPDHRLLLAISIYDIIESVWNFASTWPMVAGTTDVFGNVGTTGTCSAQGFFLMLGVAVPIYNACLSLYYYLVIRPGAVGRNPPTVSGTGHARRGLCVGHGNGRGGPVVAIVQ